MSSRLAKVTFPLGFVGALLGARLVLYVQPEVLKPVVLVLLLAGVPSWRGVRSSNSTCLPRGAGQGSSRSSWRPTTASSGRRGTFLIAAFVGLLGITLTRASAEAKVVNFASNIAALGLFASRGTVLWTVALPMALAQLLGGALGAHLAIAGGDRWIRWAVVGVVAVLVLKLAHDLLGN